MLQGPGPRLEHFSNRPISALQRPRRRTAMRSLAAILNPAAAILAVHARPKVRQMEPRARDRHRHSIPRVQTEKPYARLAICHHVRPHIQFRKCRQPRYVRRPSKPHARHAKRHHRNPGLPLERVDLQPSRDERPQHRRIDPPMGKQQVVPRLRHHPWT